MYKALIMILCICGALRHQYLCEGYHKESEKCLDSDKVI